MARPQQLTRLGGVAALSIGLVALPFVAVGASAPGVDAGNAPVTRAAAHRSSGRLANGTQLAQYNGGGAPGTGNGAGYGYNRGGRRRGGGGWGLIGLIGLLGLFGLRPTRSNRTVVGTTSTPPIR